MTSTETSSEARKILIFSFDQRKMGTYAENVSAVIDAGVARGREMTLTPLGELMGISSEAEIETKERNVLIVRNSDPAHGILIDSLEEIADVSPTEILPMPDSIAHSEGMAPYIGGMIKGDEIILMLDMQKIASFKETT